MVLASWPLKKHKGEPVELVAATDPEYCKWAAMQPWFREQHSNIYNILVQAQPEAEASPEHNQMQAAFLEDTWREALLFHLGFVNTGENESFLRSRLFLELREFITFSSENSSLGKVQFENKGWDVSFKYEPGRFICNINLVNVQKKCNCSKLNKVKDRYFLKPDKHQVGCFFSLSNWGVLLEKPLLEYLEDEKFLSTSVYDWSFSTVKDWLSVTSQERQRYGISKGELDILIEIKPDLGDDYPVVLRQIKGYPKSSHARVILLVRRQRFENVSPQEVKKVFQNSNIILIEEESLVQKIV